MRRTLVFYDMDNTIAEMSRKLTGIDSAGLEDYYYGNPAEVQVALRQRGFFQDLAVIGNAIEVISALAKDNRYDVRILSQPMTTAYCIDEKNYWLNRFFPFIPRHKRIYTFDKWILSGMGRVLVDDNPSHLIPWKAVGGIGICFQRGYNKSYEGLSIQRHHEIFQLLEKLGKDGRI